MTRPRARTAAAAAVVAFTCAALTVLAGCTSSGSGAGASSSQAGPSSTAPGTTAGVAPSGTPASTTGSAAAGPKAVHQKLTNFRIVDVTVVGSQAWALGSADCLSGKGVCDAIEYSGDGGRTWRSAPAPRANVQGTARPNCADPCVAHLRFASATVGYAYGAARESTSGSGSLFLTTDGGSTWTRQPGAADALESLDGNVIRVRDAGGCPPGCTYTVQTAAVGGTSWHTVSLPGARSQGDGVFLARTGSHAYLLETGNPAGGAQSARSVLWTSADDGARWTRRGEPCPQGGGSEVNSSRLSSGPDGTVAVLCSGRGNDGPTFVAVSTDAGRSFAVRSRTALGAADVTALAVGSASTVLVSSDETYGSTNGGASFARLSANGGSSPGEVSTIGFASPSVVHAFLTGSRLLWTSTDAGASWTSHRF